MKDAKQVNAMVIDGGQCVDMAVALAPQFRTLRFTPYWQSAEPTLNQRYIGYGLEGIERIPSIFSEPYFSETDLFIFLDLYQGPTQVHLESMGKKVWGPRLGEMMELDRKSMKAIMRKVGLPVNDYEIIKGVTALRKYLKANADVIVKMSECRGSWETRRAKNYDSIKPVLDEFELEHGSLSEVVEFIVEKPIDEESEKKPVVEIGMDLWSVAGKFPSRCIGGVEVKNKCYLCKFRDYKDFPECLRGVNDKLSSVLRRTGYTGFFSTECRNQYLIDWTARHPSPPGEIWQMVPNMGECMWAAANGEVLDPKSEFPFYAQARIQSHWAEKHPQPVIFPESIRRHVKLSNVCKIEGRPYEVIPQAVGIYNIGSVVDGGNTKEEAIAKCKAKAKLIEGTDIEVMADSLDEADAVLKTSEKAGYPVF